VATTQLAGRVHIKQNLRQHLTPSHAAQLSSHGHETGRPQQAPPSHTWFVYAVCLTHPQLSQAHIRSSCCQLPAVCQFFLISHTSTATAAAAACGTAPLLLMRLLLLPPVFRSSYALKTQAAQLLVCNTACTVSRP
jgi:hypothetical protein